MTLYFATREEARRRVPCVACPKRLRAAGRADYACHIGLSTVDRQPGKKLRKYIDYFELLTQRDRDGRGVR